MSGARFWSDGTPILDDVTDPWGSVAEQCWVRVMAEMTLGGLWDASGQARHPDELPISAALCQRIERWSAWHDELDDANRSFPNPMYWEMRSDMPVAAFNAEGRAIARALKAELPANWTVIAFDVDGWCRTKSADAIQDVELILRGTRDPS